MRHVSVVATRAVRAVSAVRALSAARAAAAVVRAALAAAAVRAALAAAAVRAALAAAVVLAAALPSLAQASWTWPVRGEVITPFVLGPDRFARGQHRGIDIAARAGAPVRAACGGRVRFAGRVPGRGGGVTVVCGALVATHLELARVFVRRGHRVAAGAPVGTVAASHVQLGARRAGRAHGYLDPLELLGADPPPPLGAVPSAGRPPARRPLPAPARPAPVPGPVAHARAVAAPDPHAAPLTAWLGLAALALATPVGAVLRRCSRRRRLVATRRVPAS